MLQQQTYQEHVSNEDSGQIFDLGYIFEILKRRAFYFVIPFILILVIGTLITIAWPARYLAVGKILVSSQEIPLELVRPTVATLANERMQVIEQRIMTRDNLLSLATKFSLSQSWQGLLLGTEIVDFIRDRTHIKPLELNLQSQTRNNAVAFTVGFEYEKPQIAMGVANEIVTMILKQDVRTRTNYASETTKFLERDVSRIEDQLRSLDATISERTRVSGGGSNSNNAKELAELRSQLLANGAVYSQSHPNIIALKRRIEILEKSTAATSASKDQSESSASKNADPSQRVASAANSQATSTVNPNEPGLDALETKRKSLKVELEGATAKVAAAHLGESLERGQHSERLEVIEQPTLPQNPISPNRPKIFAFVVAFALMAGGGLLVGAEALNPAIRRKADILPLIDRRLLVSIPHIYTHGEARRKRNKILLVSASGALVVVVGLAVILFVLPPLDVLFQKAAAALIR